MACSSMILTWERWHYWHNACRLSVIFLTRNVVADGDWNSGVTYCSLQWLVCIGGGVSGRILLHPSERQHCLYTLLVHLHMSSPRYIRYFDLALEIYVSFNTPFTVWGIFIYLFYFWGYGECTMSVYKSVQLFFRSGCLEPAMTMTPTCWKKIEKEKKKIQVQGLSSRVVAGHV